MKMKKQRKINKSNFRGIGLLPTAGTPAWLPPHGENEKGKRDGRKTSLGLTLRSLIIWTIFPLREWIWEFYRRIPEIPEYKGPAQKM